ncbi:MAG: polysaccharide biosynthesis protein [Peptococcaceae bacterium]|nr:polysaccharide biosynthesis protein [Peptococcaceae bacterium]MBQ2369877.1 polysaccharide biosynthesis protein [Peptococcaceae bacterium]MBQ2432162.1 polysaccharide biosynthesis protein [Peptococcaceae bacterium]MBQ5368930.1 polysaccharide biosynthesis protein [Peptococcaceae bacterium]MBQ5658154.1 polysaccharide biosynthesis protein [Peptococcaceae bacterium]
MSGKSFVKGAVVLSVAGIMAKCLGALYRIPFARIASDECGAIYALVYPIYNLLLALSTAGIPLAISKLVAEYEEQGKSGMSLRILKLSLLLLASIGIVVAVALFISADWIATTVWEVPGAAISIRVITPAMIFTCIQAVFRGYFQGMQQMVPTALSQITEQFVRVTVIFAALFLLMPYGDEVTAAGATFGATVGSGMALALMLTIFFLYRKKQKNNPLWISRMDDLAESISNSQVLKKVVALAIPIAIGSLVLPVMQSIDSILVLSRLQAGGLSLDTSLVEFNYLGNCVQPIINLPFMITTAVAASLVPNISEALAMGQNEKVRVTFANAMQLAILIVLPATVGLMTLATPIMELLYDKPGAGVAMFWSAAVVLVVGLYQISAGTLQGMGKAMVPMYSLLIGAAIKILLTFTLTAMPAVGIRGAAIGSVIGFAVAAGNNVYQVSRKIGWGWLSSRYHVVKPLISVVVMAVLVLASYSGIYMLLDSNGLATLVSIAIGGCAYFAVLLAIGGVSLEIIRKVPKLGNKLATLLLKLKLVRE